MRRVRALHRQLPLSARGEVRRRPELGTLAAALFLAAISAGCTRTYDPGRSTPSSTLDAREARTAEAVELRARPRYLVSRMDPGPLKTALAACVERPLTPTRFSIGHRGAPRGFPEHSKESYEAAAAMGAGLIECDVTFTKDRQLVCRHSQCDLHTTTNILAVPSLAARCSTPFAPAAPKSGRDASARCCTSDVTLAEFESLCARMDSVDPRATTVTGYLRAPPSADHVPAALCGKVMSHAESIALIAGLRRDFIPELKAPSVPMPFDGTYTLDDYRARLVKEYEDAGIAPERVFLQSTNRDDLAYWFQHDPEFARNAVFLDEGVDEPDGYERAIGALPALAATGVRSVGPPMWALLELDAHQAIVPSRYARAAKESGLALLTWTFERSGSLEHGGGYYYQSVSPVIAGDGDAYVVLDVLAKQVGVRGVFSDWPATVTYYANCMGL